MTFALARSLLLADAVTPAALAEALFLSATRGTSLVRTLLAARAIDTLRLEQVLERGEAPYMRHIAPVTALVERLPPGLCDRLLAIPVRSDPRTGTVDVAVVDARDPHPAEELSHWLKAPVRIVRTSIATMEAALLRIVTRPEADADVGMKALAPPIWAPSPVPVPSRPSRTPMYGSPAFDAAVAALEPPTEDPDIAIPLTRRNIGGDPIISIGLPAVEREAAPRPAGATGGGDAGPVLDLKRRKSRTLPLPERPVSSVPSETPARLSPESGPPPPSASGPENAATIVAQMASAQDRDQILDLLVTGTTWLARRAAVLAVRRDALVGWTGSLEIAGRQALRGVRLVNAMPTVFHDAFDRDGARLVRIPVDAAHAPLVGVMRSPPAGQVVVAAVRAEGKPVAVVFADGVSDPRAALERVALLAEAAGEALGQLLRDRRAEKHA